MGAGDSRGPVSEAKLGQIYECENILEVKIGCILEGLYVEINHSNFFISTSMNTVCVFHSH